MSASRQLFVNLAVDDLDRSVAFYRALGFQVDEGPQICVAHFGTQMINAHLRAGRAGRRSVRL